MNLLHRSTSLRSIASAMTLVIVAWATLSPSTLGAQPTRAATPRLADSTSAVCMNVTWLDAGAICEGRMANAISASVLSGLAGGIAGAAGGALAPTTCLGGAEGAALRGMAMGAGLGFVSGLLVKQVSRRQLAVRNAAEREEARRNPTKAWSWRDVRPVFVVAGASALGGAAIGGMRGATSAACTEGAGPNALRGAALYGGGTLASIGVSLVAVRWLF